MKLSEITVDAARIEDGEWVENIPEMEGLSLRVRGIGNAPFRRMQSRLIDALPRNRRVGGRIDPADQDRITGQCLAATVLLDWKGLEADDGSALPYCTEEAKKFLTEPAYRRFRDAVVWASTVVGEQRGEDEKADAGNSAST